MAKLFFDNKDIDAILAAAKNKEEFSNTGTNADAEGEEIKSNFLHRLHQNSQLLNSDSPVKNIPVGKKEEGQHSSYDDGFLSSSSSLPSSHQPNAKQTNGGIITRDENEGNSNANNQIKLEIPANIINKLNQLFGECQKDEFEINKPLDVFLPLWMCEFLYKATKRIPIADSLPKAAIRKKGKKVDTSAGHFLKLSVLTELYQMFPEVPKNTIKQCAKENRYDMHQTADHILTISAVTDLQISEDIDSDTAKNSIVVPSNYPFIISEEEQQRPRDSSPPNLEPEEWQYAEEIGLFMEKELGRIEQDQKYCIEMGTKNVGLKGAALSSYYLQKAQRLKKEKYLLELKFAQYRVWNEHSNCELDLHWMSWESAVETVKYKIDLCRMKHPDMRKLNVITGYGKTTGQPSTIRAKLLQFLKQNNIEYSISNQNKGMVVVSLQGIRQYFSTE